MTTAPLSERLGALVDNTQSGGGLWNELATRAREAVEVLRTFEGYSRWRSVDDEMPAPFTIVYVLLEKQDDEVVRTRAFYAGGYWYEVTSSAHTMESAEHYPTHWAPILEPPYPIDTKEQADGVPA